MELYFNHGSNEVALGGSLLYCTDYGCSYPHRCSQNMPQSKMQPQSSCLDNCLEIVSAI